MFVRVTLFGELVGKVLVQAMFEDMDLDAVTFEEVLVERVGGMQTDQVQRPLWLELDAIG